MSPSLGYRLLSYARRERAETSALGVHAVAFGNPLGGPIRRPASSARGVRRAALRERYGAIPGAPAGARCDLGSCVYRVVGAACGTIDRFQCKPDGSAAKGSKQHAFPGVAHERLQSPGGGAPLRQCVRVVIPRAGQAETSRARCGRRTIPPVSQATDHVDGEALARSLADLNLPDSDDIDVQGGIARVVRGAAGVFAGSGVGLMLIAEDGHSLRYVASSDELARELELAHEESGEGPCVDAFVCDSCVSTEDLATESRWPDLRAALAGRPIRAVVGMPTRLGAPVGTLNVYCDQPRAWDESEIAALEAYNSLLEARLAESLLTKQHDRVVGQLQFALDSRVAIERAIGLLMGRDGVDGATAFNELRRAARSSRRRVNAVAEELLAEHPQAAADVTP